MSFVFFIIISTLHGHPTDTVIRQLQLFSSQWTRPTHFDLYSSGYFIAQSQKLPVHQLPRSSIKKEIIETSTAIYFADCQLLDLFSHVHLEASSAALDSDLVFFSSLSPPPPILTASCEVTTPRETSASYINRFVLSMPMPLRYVNISQTSFHGHILFPEDC